MQLAGAQDTFDGLVGPPIGMFAKKEKVPFEQKYELLDKLGEGTYGVVYRAKDRTTGEIVALKKVKLHDTDEGVPSCTIREVSLLKELDHPYIVKLHDIMYSSRETLYLVFEFLDLDLHHYMRNYGRIRKSQNVVPVLDPLLVKSYMLQMLEGCCFCHMQRIMHRDLKPANLLVTKDGRLKIADFGLARAYGVPLSTYTHEVVTLWYRAPEILLGGRIYSPAVDMWSIGLIFAELITFEPLFPGDSEIDQLFHIFQILGTPTEETWPGVSELPDYKPTFPKWKARDIAKAVPKLAQNVEPAGIDLLKRMLVFEPSKRISAREALEHEYFADVIHRRTAQTVSVEDDTNMQ